MTAAVLLHDSGMSIHRTDHEQFSLFLAADKLPSLLDGIYDEPEKSVIAAEALHAIIGHRRRGDPMTLEAGVVRVADALDMEQGRSRVPFSERRPNIHSLSAAAIDDVKIEPGEERAVRIEIEMNNSVGIFQVDELLATKLRGLAARGARRGDRAHRRRAREAARADLPDLGSARRSSSRRSTSSQGSSTASWSSWKPSSGW